MTTHNLFPLQIGSLVFDKKALANLLFGFFFIGLLVGVYSMIHLQHPTAPFAVTSPLLVGLIIPAFFISKGVKKVTVKNRQNEKIKVPQATGTKTLSDTIDSSAEVNAI